MELSSALPKNYSANLPQLERLIDSIQIPQTGYYGDTFNTYSAIRKKFRSNNSCLVKADTGEALVVISNHLYEDKVYCTCLYLEKFLQDDKLMEELEK